MKIIKVTPISGFAVEVEEMDLHCQYTRYAHDCWTMMMGESDEPVYDSTAVEALFQQWHRGREIS